MGQERSGRGRQSEARRNDQSLIDAAREVFARHGPEAPVSAVAAEAGVGIASLYRRYATKQDLLQHLCLVSLDQQAEAARTALAAGDDDWANLCRYIRTCVGFRAGVFGAIAGTIPVTAEMIATAVEAHQLVAELVQRAQASGSLRPDVNAVDIFELVALFSRRDSTSSAATQRLLEIALAGLRDGASGSLPHQAVTWAGYAAGWNFQDDGDDETRQVPGASPRVSG